MTAHFITLEGGEGSGKSTQLQLLAKSMTAANIPCVTTREPGGSPGAEDIRKLLVTGKTDAWDAETETLLFYAARLDHVNKLIKPALESGKTVICDRFTDSTQVYQGAGKGLPETYIRMLHRMTLGDFLPNLTLILDIDPMEGLKRAGTRRGSETRFENMDVAFHQRVRAAFLSIAKAEPHRCAVVSAAGDIKSIHTSLIEIINQRLGFVLKPSA